MTDGQDSAKLVLICFVVMYSGLSILAVIRTGKIYNRISLTNYAKIFYISACAESITRALTITSIVVDMYNMDYNILFLLVSVPDGFFIIIYLLLLILTVDIYHFSHLSSTQTSSFLHKPVQKSSKFIVLALLIIINLLLVQFISYIVFLMNEVSSITVTEENSYVNIIVPVLGFFYILYLDYLYSGVPTKSVFWKGNLHKICYVSFFWSITRVTKGVLDLLGESSIVSIVNAIVNPRKSSATLLTSALCIGVIIISEMICLFLVLDYGFLGIFIEAEPEETTPRVQKFKHSLVASNPFVEQSEIEILEELQDNKKKPLGKVYKAEYQGEVVFYRIMSFSRLSAYVSEEITREIESYKGMSISGIVPVIGIVFQTQTVGLVYPYFRQGSLYQYVHSQRKLHYNQKIGILQNIAESLEEIHGLGRCHGHLTSHNILMSEDMEPVIADLGFHKMKKYAGIMYGYNYKSPWSSPEVLKDRKIVPNIEPSDDSYSYGMICWELFTEQVPFDGCSKRQLIESVVNQSYRPLIPGDMQEDIARLIKSCWSTDPNKRADMRLIATTMKRIQGDLL